MTLNEFVKMTYEQIVVKKEVRRIDANVSVEDWDPRQRDYEACAYLITTNPYMDKRVTEIFRVDLKIQ